MSLGQKLINRLGAQARKVKRLAPDFESINMQTRVLARAAGSQKLILSAQRQTDQSGIGLAVLAEKIEVAKRLPLDATLSIVSSHLQAVINNIGLAEIAQFIALADAPAGIKQVDTISCVADNEGSLNNTYFLINSANNDNQYYVWYNVANTGIDPMVANRISVMASVYQNAPASVVASATAAALTAAGPDFVASATGDLVTCTLQAVGPANAPGQIDYLPPYNGGTGFSFAIETLGQQILSLNDKYLVLYDAAGSVAVWYDVAGGGTAPVGFHRTIQVNVAALASAQAVGAATGAALHADAQFAPSNADGSTINAVSNVLGQYGVPGNGTSQFAMTEIARGTNNAMNLLQIKATDLAEVLSGQLIGNFYTISSINNNVITFVEDPAGYAGESNISLRFEMRTTIPAIKYLPSEQE